MAGGERAVMERLLRLLFPPRCAACETLLDWYDSTKEAALCPSCEETFRKEARERCLLCDRPVSDCLCVTELMRRAKCETFVKLCFYRQGTRQAVANRLVYHVKEQRDRVTERYLAKALWERLRKQISNEECVSVTYLPRTRRARATYGNDQAEALARMLAAEAGCPFVHALVRSKQGEHEQKKLTSAGRRRNARRAFLADPRAELYGRTVILVDDVVTTGASMAACAALLRRAGAARVYCMAVASDDVNRDPLPKRV